MCIIITKNKGINLPDKETLENCYSRNPDGCGYAFTKNNKVYVKKGFFNFDNFYNDLINNVNKDNAAIIHFRITTHGGTNGALTHPFCISKHFNFITTQKAITKMAVAHNGILSITSNAKKPHSDTTLFIKKYISEIIKRPQDLKNKNKIAIINNLIGFNNKLAFLTNDQLITLGRGWIFENGCYFSNRSYEDIKPLNLKQFRWDFDLDLFK